MERMVLVVIAMENLGKDLYIKVPRGTVVKNAKTRKSDGRFIRENSKRANFKRW